MNLTLPQREYLELLTERPSNQPTNPRRWWTSLWLANCFDIVGDSVYINDTGRAALEGERASSGKEPAVHSEDIVENAGCRS